MLVSPYEAKTDLCARERERERDLVSQTVWTVLCPVKIISRVCRADCQQKKYQNKNLMTNLRDGQTDIAQLTGYICSSHHECTEPSWERRVGWFVTRIVLFSLTT